MARVTLSCVNASTDRVSALGDRLAGANLDSRPLFRPGKFIHVSDTEELLEYLEQRAGESLRAVGQYQGEECDLQYLRDDLPRTATRDRLDALRANITWSWNPPEDASLKELGTKRATLQVREQAVILHLLLGNQRGILIGLEPEAARDLTSFITDCLDHVDGP